MSPPPRPGCGPSPTCGSRWPPGSASRTGTRRSGTGSRTRTHGRRRTTSTSGSGTSRRPSWRRSPRAERSVGPSCIVGSVGPGRRPKYAGPVLTIDRATYDAIVAHAKRDHPDEACGIVAGPEGTDRPERLVEMVNAAGSPTFYEFDSTELLALYKDMWARDEEPIVVYHPHTATEAYPSRTDIGLANEPGAHDVLVGTREHGNTDGPVEFRSYRIVDGEVTEEEVVLVDSPPHTPTTP